MTLHTRVLADGNVELNVAVFDTDYTDLQVNVFISEIATFVTQNAASAHTTGIEFDGRWAVSDNFTIGFNGAFTEAEFDDYLGQECNMLEDKQYLANNPGSAPGDCSGVNNAGGQRLPVAPEWQVGISPSYTWDMGSNLTARFTANATFSDGYPTTADRDVLAFADDWERIDLRLAFAPRDADWEVAIYGRNVTDDRKYHGSSAGDFMSRSTDLIFDGGTTTAFERERRYGVQFNYFFGN